jgi:hypothetical protein
LPRKKRKEKKQKRQETKSIRLPVTAPGFSPILPVAVGFNRRTGEGKKKERSRKEADPPAEEEGKQRISIHITFYIRD